MDWDWTLGVSMHTALRIVGTSVSRLIAYLVVKEWGKHKASKSQSARILEALALQSHCHGK